MKRLIRIAICALVCAWLPPPAAFAAGAFKRLAVMDFENATGDRTLDWLGVGISETLSTELSRIRDLTLVERKRLNDALKEIKLGRSQAVDQATAQKMGKMLGADSVVVGSFQRSPQGTLRLQARVVDVETGAIRVPARVDGALKDIFDLQIDLAKKLVEEMKGSLAEADKRSLEVAPSKNVDALRAYSDGVYFYRNDLAQDAVTEFDRALALDPNYGEAHFYRGMALAKLKRWDDAIIAFKRTLPRTQAEHRVKWSWDVPFEAEGSARIVFPAFDAALYRAQDVFSRAGPLRRQKRIVYTERRGAGSILHLVDLERRTAKRTELPIESMLPVALATDRLTGFMSSTLASLFSGKMAIYGVDAADGGLLWRDDLSGLGGFPLFGIADSVLWEYFPPIRRLVARTESALQPKWQRNDIDLEWGVPPVSSTRTHGSLLIVKSATERKIHAIRMADGLDAWTVSVQGDKSYQMVSDQALIIFEPDRRVLAVDLETGKPLIDLPVRQAADTRTVALASLITVRALVQDNTLFFSSDADELLAVDLDRATPAERRVRWKTPLGKKVLTISAHGSHVYIGTEGGELLILDAKAGNVQASRRVADKSLGVDYAGDDIVVASSEESIFGFDRSTGVKQWQYPSNARAQKPFYFKGVVILQTSNTQISALDAKTGGLIWQYTGKLAPEGFMARLLGVQMPSVYLTDDAFFIVEQGGVKEYDLERGAGQGITNKEALTELANAQLAKGDIAEASRFAGTAREADPDFPPLRLLQARLAQARGDAAAARRELLVYVDLAGRQSRSGQDIVAELKRDHGLIWQAELGKGSLDGSRLVDAKRLITLGRVAGRDAQFALLETSTGAVLWRQNAERMLDVTYDAASRRAFFVRGQTSDPKAVQLNAVDLDSGTRRELARLTSAYTVNSVTIAFANDRIFVATTAADVPTRKMSIRITCFNATSGTRLWEAPHNFTDVNFQDVLVPMGLFYPMKDLLVYSIGRDLRVLRAADGTIQAEHHENAVIFPRISSTAVLADDVTHFSTVTGELVGYNVATRQVVLRTSLPALDVKWIEGTAGASEGVLLGDDVVSVFAIDLSPTADAARRLQWRVTAPPGQSFGWVFRSGDAVWTYRSDNVLLQLDRVTGKILNEYPLLWVPVGVRLDGDRLYAFTSDGQAYAMHLKPAGR